MSHTPGPWTKREHKYGSGGFTIQPKGRFFDYALAATYYQHDEDGNATYNAEANAHLIAAAPALLAACKAHCVVGDHVAICPKCGDGRECQEYNTLYHKADELTRAATAQAEATDG
jgi:hypothetical protein